MITTSLLDQIRDLALQAGATHARVLAHPLESETDVWNNCALNACGIYGECWTCPPDLGDLDELAARLREYPTGVVVQNVTRLDDPLDYPAMQRAALEHNRFMRKLARRVRDALPGRDILPLGCGGCGVCAVCTCPDEPCPYPDQALASVEGYGLDVQKLVVANGLRYTYGEDSVAYVGLVLVRG